MKKLFGVKNLITGKIVNRFENKTIAKKERDFLNSQQKKKPYCITKGKDHKDFGAERVSSVHPKKEVDSNDR